MLLFAGLWRWLVSTAALVYRLLGLLRLTALEIRAGAAMPAAPVPAVTVIPVAVLAVAVLLAAILVGILIRAGILLRRTTGDEGGQTVEVARVLSALLGLRLRLVLLVLPIKPILGEHGYGDVTFSVRARQVECALCGCLASPTPSDPTCDQCGAPLPRRDGPAVTCREVALEPLSG